MTRDEKKQILEGALERAYEILRDVPGEELGWPEVRVLLKNLDLMEGMVKYTLADFPESTPEPAQPEPKETGVAAPVEPAAVTTSSGISKDELREKLTTYSNAHEELDVAAIMNSMGYAKLSEVPAERYTELLEKVECAIRGDA